MEQVGPCLILPSFQTFITLALSEIVEVGHRTRAWDYGGINRNENTVAMHGSFFLFREFLLN